MTVKIVARKEKSVLPVRVMNASEGKSAQRSSDTGTGPGTGGKTGVGSFRQHELTFQ